MADDKFSERPDFVNTAALQQDYSCGLCSEILLRPHQTACGKRVCKTCIDGAFGLRRVIRCPFSHNDLNESETECCQTEGLEKEMVYEDPCTHKALMKERCYCVNRLYGCCEEMPWRKLESHKLGCPYSPVECPNEGCSQLFDYLNLLSHQETCDYGRVECNYCNATFTRKDMQEHLHSCDKVDTHCLTCQRIFVNYAQLQVHEKTNPDCLFTAGKCYYYSSCKFESDDLEQLRGHMMDPSVQSFHLESLTLRVQDLEEDDENPDDIVSRAAASRIVNLTKVILEIGVHVTSLEQRRKDSVVRTGGLKKAMQHIERNSQEAGALDRNVFDIGVELKEAGLDGVTSVDTRTRMIGQNARKIAKIGKQLKNAEHVRRDGILVWKLDKYTEKKRLAVRDTSTSERSHPFYTPDGYKMCCKAYLNGDEIGRRNYLSLHFFLLKGPHDDLLTFPFTREVTVRLLAPRNRWRDKTRIIMPDPDSAAFQKPQKEMNPPAKISDFALQQEVESADYLIDDCIYLHVKVASGPELPLC